MSSFITTTPVRFKEYNAVEYNNTDGNNYLSHINKVFKGYKGNTEVVNQSIYSYNLFEIDKSIYKNDSDYLPEDVKDKWVYVFRTTNYQNDDGSNILVNKIKITEAGKTYQLPIFERHNNMQKAVFSFFCLSQIELSDKRLDQLRYQLNGLINRAVIPMSRAQIKCNRLTFIPLDIEQIDYISRNGLTYLYNGLNETENVIQTGEDDNKITTVFLTDYLKIAKGMSQTYQDNKNEFKNHMNTERNYRINGYSFDNIKPAEISTIAEIANSLCDAKGLEERHREHLHYDSLLEWRKTLLDETKPMIDLYTQSAAMFLPWIKQKTFHAMLFDYSFDSDESADFIENELGNMFELLSEEIQGRSYLKEIFNDSLNQLNIFNSENDNSKLNIENLSTRFQEDNWFTVCFYVARKGPDGFSKILSAVNTVISMNDYAKSIENFKTIIDHRFTNNLVSITNYKLAQYHNRYANILDWEKAMNKRYPGCKFYIKDGVKYAGYEGLEVNQSKIAKYLKNAQGGVGKFMTALSIFNLGVSLYNITKTTNTKDAIIKTLVAGGSLTNLILKFLGTTSKVTLSKVGIITALIDAINSENNRYKALSMNDRDLAQVQGVVTAGNIIAATGCAITLAAYVKAGAIGGGAIGSTAAGAGAVPGAAVGAIVGFIGGLIIIGGTVIANHVTDSEYETWLEHCLWGKSFCDGDEKPEWATESFDKWHEKLYYQSISFNNIQYTFSIELTYNTGLGFTDNKNILKLLIEPRALQVISKMYVTLWITNGNTTLEIENSKEILENQFGTVLAENTPQNKIFLRWCESKKNSDINEYLLDEILQYREEYVMTINTTDFEQTINKIKKDLIIRKEINDEIKVLMFNKDNQVRGNVTMFAHVKLDIYGDNSAVITKTIRPVVPISLSESDLIRLDKKLQYT